MAENVAENEKPDRHFVGAHLPIDLYEKLKARAARRDRALSAELRLIVREALGD